MEAKLLVTLVEKYEKEHYPIVLPEPVHAINEAMEMKGPKDKDLIPAIGNKTTVSFVLNRKRALTIDMVMNLTELLGFPAEAIIQSYKLDGRKKMVKSII